MQPRATFPRIRGSDLEQYRGGGARRRISTTMAQTLSARPAREDPNAPGVAEFSVRIPGQPRPLARYEGLLLGAGAVLVFVAVWQLVAFRRLMPELFLPGPSDIGAAFGAYIAKGPISEDLWVRGPG